MENANLDLKVIEQIKEKHIKPTPKWEFVAKNIALWLVLVFLLIVGSLASSVIIYMIDTNQWDLYDDIRHNFLAFILATLPYFWLLILIILVSAIYYYFRQTKSGYKYHIYAVILASFLLSSILGLIFYNAGLAHTIDKIFEKRMPLYLNLINPRQKVFSRPEFGVLPGQIVKIINNQEMVIIDIKNNPWDVFLSPAIINCPCAPGNNIIALGEVSDDQIFKAYEIREFKPRYIRPQKFWQYFQLRILQPR